LSFNQQLYSQMPQAPSIQQQLDAFVAAYNRRDFIADDPIVVPHGFSKAQDIEIAGFFAAIFAWGQRKTIIAKAQELMQRMDGAPHAFVLSASERELRGLAGFVHRTFNDTDLLYMVDFLGRHYRQHPSLEQAFVPLGAVDWSVEKALWHFHQQVFLPDWAPQRSRKHIPTPARNSACKRLNMYLRWMVRKDAHGVDFGLWQQLKPADLIVPLDLHVQRVALKMGLLQRTQSDWQAALELTEALRQFDPHDPVKYDFALFGMGLEVRRGADW
jgi:uncharacterized protein (TIGR02757 family)